MTVQTTAKKIRRFRLHARPSAVQRHLKALLGETQWTPELDEEIASEIASSCRRLETAALYETLSKEKTPPPLASHWAPAEGEKKPVALTVFVATAGKPLESMLAEALSRGEELRSRLLTALGEEWADQAGLFVYKVLTEEARQDSCELGEARTLSGAEEIQAILQHLQASRVGVDFPSGAGGGLSPRFTRVGVIPWGPASRKK